MASLLAFLRICLGQSVKIGLWSVSGKPRGIFFFNLVSGNPVVTLLIFEAYQSVGLHIHFLCFCAC